MRRVLERFIVKSMKQIRSFFSVLRLGISLMMFSVPGFSADFQKGLDAYDRGDLGRLYAGGDPLIFSLIRFRCRLNQHY